MKTQQNKAKLAHTKLTVPLSKLTTNEETFHPRLEGINESHVRALQDVLQHGQPLDPIEVWKDPSTGSLIVADGHHRLEALRRHNSAQRVSVLVYSCSKSQALLIPMRENGKTRLSLTYDDRANWAWKLTVDGTGSKSVVAAGCGVSPRTVAYMRKLKAEILKADGILPDSWREAQRGDRDEGQWSDEAREAWRDVLVEKHMRDYGTSLSHLMRKHPEAAVELIQLCGGHAFESVLEDLGYVRIEACEDEDFPF